MFPIRETIDPVANCGVNAVYEIGNAQSTTANFYIECNEKRYKMLHSRSVLKMDRREDIMQTSEVHHHMPQDPQRFVPALCEHPKDALPMPANKVLRA